MLFHYISIPKNDTDLDFRQEVFLLLLLMSLWLSTTSASFHISFPLTLEATKSVQFPIIFHFNNQKAAFYLCLLLTSHLLLFSWFGNGMIRSTFIRTVCTSQCSRKDQICIKFDTTIIHLAFLFFVCFTIPALEKKEQLETLLLPAGIQAGSGMFSKLLRQACQKPMPDPGVQTHLGMSGKRMGL